MPESDAGSVHPVCLEGRIRAKHELSYQRLISLVVSVDVKHHVYFTYDHAHKATVVREER